VGAWDLGKEMLENGENHDILLNIDSYFPIKSSHLSVILEQRFSKVFTLFFNSKF